MDNRTNKQNYYLDIADSVLERSTCLRRKYGAIIVRNDEIISTGYNGAPRGRRNCSDLGRCTRETLNIPSGQRYELCRSVHAEANAIISASRRDMIGATIYLVGRDARTNELLRDAMSCSMCKRQIINALSLKSTYNNVKIWTQFRICLLCNNPFCSIIIMN
jgi:dCMP deaminase